ncbi:hypothetical protein HYW54_05045 [Candidatus Gottesmanbacteria bacterium]|nr:hypothetical protein [Candidatus Gottesmanbacteria bacterium]
MRRKFAAILVLFTFTLNTFVPLLPTPFSPSPAYAEGNSCLASSKRAKHTPRVGGVALDMAAKFLADMTDVTGAYYDPILDRIVFMGKKNTTAPQFDKDDMAVAIKAVIFRNEIPAVSIDKIPGLPVDHPYRKVTYYGGIESTKFGKVLFDADFALKKYSHGRDENNQPIVSSVPTYKSFIQRYIEYGPGEGGNSSRFIIKPQIMTLKKDDAANSFVFDQAKMYLEIQHLNPNNEPSWNQAANDYGNEMTTNYDLYAQETPSWAQAKQLGMIVSVIRWIDDAGITTDFNFARDYAPKYVATPTQVNTFATPIGDTGTLYGEADYTTPNTYNPDSGTSSGLKNSAQAVPTTKEDVHWTFTNSGQQYEAVAVTADAFRSLGSYNTSEVDMSFPTAGDLTLAFQRVYSSFSGGQYGVGRGWNIFPAALYDNDPIHTFTCAAGTYPKALAFSSQAVGFESFTINDCNVGYVADDPAYHSKVSRNADGTFTAKTKDQTEYSFGSSYQLTKIKDKNGNTITYIYDGSGKLTSIADSKGHQITVNYGTFSGLTLISSISDWSGRTVNYTYDDQGNLLTVKDPNNNTKTYGYDTNFKLTSITDRNNQHDVTNTYTDEAKLATQKDSANVTDTYTYDKVNRVITVTDDQTPIRTQSTKYDTKARILEQTDPLSFKITYTYGTEFFPLTIKDKNNNTVTNTYDANGNLTSITYPDTKKTSFQYDANNRLTKITDERYGLPGKDTTNTYNTTGNLTQTNEAGQLTKYTYDTSGEMLTLTDPLNHIVTWTRDSFGNKLTEKDALLKTTTFEYDTIGRLKKKTDADAKVFSYTYDNNGNLLTQTDAVGTTTSVYDKENRLQKVTLPDTSVTEFTYNTSDALIAVKDPALNLSSYGYDAYQNLTSQQDALNKITTHTYDAVNRQKQSTTQMGKIYKWEYDGNGNITKRIDANNNATTYLYDVFNQLTKITYPDTKTVTFEYDARGNRTKMIDPVGTSTYVYDVFDRLTQATNAYGKVLKYTYDNANNLKTITYPDSLGGTVTYAYDNNNRLISVKDWNNKTTTYTYNNNGTLATRQLPNTVKTTYTYDAANRPITITHTKSTTTLAKYNYTRDKVGNIKIANESGSFVGTAQTVNYDYDALGRITKATYPSNKTFEYVYDKMGNRLTQKVNGTTITTYTYDNDYKLTQKGALTSFTYDNNGNQTKKPSGNFNPDPTYTYDFENRLIAHVTSAGNPYDWKYDGLGNRLRKNMQTAVTRYIYDTSGPLSRLMATSGDQNYAVTFWIYGLGLLYDTDSNYYLEDGTGSMRFITNSSGSKRSGANYDPFGNIRSSSGILPDFQFHKQQLDMGSNLYFLRARYYDPELGRFISRDPVKGSLVSPQSQNPYAYALNNPVINSDPSGEYIDTVIDVAFLAYDICQGDWGWAAVDVVMMALPVANSAIVRGGAHFIDAGTKANRIEKLQEAARIGREVHKAQQYPAGFRKERALENGLRPDAINIQLKKIIELKPDNPDAIKRGERQLEKYIEQANKQFGPGFTGEVWTYKR